MKSVIFETLPAAILVGAEAFFVVAGGVALALAPFYPRDVWFWPAAGAGVAVALIVALLLFQSARRAAATEAALAARAAGDPGQAGDIKI